MNYPMTKFSKFDRQNLKALRSEMNDLLSKYGAKSNLEFIVGNMRFGEGEGEVEIKVSAKVNGIKTVSNKILEDRVKSLGIKLVNAQGDELVDYNTRSYKYPYVYINGKDGKRYKCDASTAIMRFAV